MAYKSQGDLSSQPKRPLSEGICHCESPIITNESMAKVEDARIALPYMIEAESIHANFSSHVLTQTNIHISQMM